MLLHGLMQSSIQHKDSSSAATVKPQLNCVSKKGHRPGMRAVEVRFQDFMNKLECKEQCKHTRSC